MIIKRRHKYFATCDGCGADLEPEYDYLDMVASMKAAGWKIVALDKMSSQWFHFCPVCRERRERHD